MVPKWSPCVPQVVYLWPLSIIFDILEAPSFRKYSTWPVSCSWLYLAVPGCTWLYLALPSSSIIYPTIDCYRLRMLAPPCPASQNGGNPQGAAGQNWLQIPLIPLFITATNDALKEERVGIFSFYFVCRLWLSSSQKYLLKVRRCLYDICIRIRSNLRTRIIFVFVFGPENSIRSPPGRFQSNIKRVLFEVSLLYSRAFNVAKVLSGFIKTFWCCGRSLRIYQTCSNCSVFQRKTFIGESHLVENIATGETSQEITYFTILGEIGEVGEPGEVGKAPTQPPTHTPTYQPT